MFSGLPGGDPGGPPQKAEIELDNISGLVYQIATRALRSSVSSAEVGPACRTTRRNLHRRERRLTDPGK